MQHRLEVAPSVADVVQLGSVPGGVALISGGLGALGLLVAEWALQTGISQRVVLLGRSGHGPAARTASSAHVCMAVRCDASSSQEVCVLSAVPPSAPQIRVVVHAAGVLRDGTLLRQHRAALAAVFAAKLSIAGLLRNATVQCGAPVRADVSFSSVAGVFGSAGQSSYSAANAAVAALATDAACRGLSSLPISFGAWAAAAGGMATADQSTLARMARVGLGALQPQEGLGALASALACLAHAPTALAAAPPHCVAAELDPQRMLQAGVGSDELADLTSAAGARGRASSEGLARQLPTAGLRQGSYVATVAAAVAELLGAPVDEHAPLLSAGLDSLGAVELRNALERASGLELPVTLLFDHPTIADLGGHLDSIIGGATAARSENAHAVAVRLVQPAAATAIVVVAASARLPAADALPDGALGGVRLVPTDRWDRDRSVAGAAEALARFGAFLERVAAFDACAFGMTAESECRAMDPQQRLVLESCAETLLAASPLPSLADDAAMREATGVCMGAQWAEYGHLCGLGSNAGVAATQAWLATGAALSVVAGRVAFTFGLGGAALSIDTACSAALIATHTAASWLHAGTCRAALAGGVNLMLAPWNSAAIARAGMLATDGRCKTLDAAADGYSRGEACGVLRLFVLPLSQLIRAETPAALLLIRGSASNQDGRSAALTTPNGRAQSRVIAAALEAAGVPEATLGLLEMHGTGTALGDPIEVAAAETVLRCAGAREVPLQYAAQKARTGHAEAAAGCAGLAAALSGLRACAHAPLMHLRTCNPHLPRSAGADVPSHLPRQHAGLSSAHPSQRSAGISSFAFMGTNAHVVLANERAASPPWLATAARVAWERRRVWCGPPTLLLQGQLTSSRGSGVPAVATFALGPYNHPQLAPLLSNRVLGVRVLPVASVFEMAAAATATLADDIGGAASQMLTRATLPAPVSCVPPTSGQPPAWRRLQLTVGRDGSMEISSWAHALQRSGSATQASDSDARLRITHFTATVGCGPVQLLPNRVRPQAPRAAARALPPMPPAPSVQRALRRTVLGRCGVQPSTAETAGFLAHPCWSECLLQSCNLGGVPELRSTLGRGGGKPPVLLTASVRAYVCAPGGAPPTAWSWLTLQTPAAILDSKRWAVDRLVARGGSSATNRAPAIQFAGVTCVPLDTVLRDGSARLGTPRAAAGELRDTDVSATTASLSAQNGGLSSLPDARATPRSQRQPVTRADRLELCELVSAHVRQAVQDVVGREIDIDAPLMDSGIDSIAWVEIRNSLQETLGLELDLGDVIAAAPTISNLITHLQATISATRAVADMPLPLPLQAFNSAQAATQSAAASSEPAVAARSGAVVDETGVLMRTLRPEKPPTLRPLFLGAPAFGDGALAYMTLARALEAALPGVEQPIYTLERDEETPWPELCVRHAEQVRAVQPQGPYLLGGHSLGGLLALETAVVLEASGCEVGAIFLFDSSHPSQFKVEWLEAPEPGERLLSPRAYALSYMQVIMRALHFDFAEVQWERLSTEDKFTMFEDLTWQALGKRYSAEEFAGAPLPYLVATRGPPTCAR